MKFQTISEFYTTSPFKKLNFIQTVLKVPKFTVKYKKKTNVSTAFSEYVFENFAVDFQNKSENCRKYQNNNFSILQKKHRTFQRLLEV